MASHLRPWHCSILNSIYYTQRYLNVLNIMRRQVHACDICCDIYMYIYIYICVCVYVCIAVSCDLQITYFSKYILWVIPCKTNSTATFNCPVLSKYYTSPALRSIQPHMALQIRSPLAQVTVSHLTPSTRYLNHVDLLSVRSSGVQLLAIAREIH